MPDHTPGSTTQTPNEEPGPGTLFQVLVTGERDPTAIYTAVREVESMAGQNVVTQLSSQIEMVATRLEARLDAVDARFDAVETRFDAVDTRFDSIDKHLRLIWSFLFTLLAMLVALLLR